MNLKKVIIAPDSFKGTLSSKQVADLIATEVTAIFPECTVIKMPIADGGEGSVDTIIAAMGGQIFETQVLSPDDRKITATFGIIPTGTAIIEMAQSSGLTKQKGLHPMSASTYGFGQLILAALQKGAENFILCIGGSATTDGGCGMAAALGVLFLNNLGNSFIPSGGTLIDIAHIEMSGIDSRICKSKFTVMCDVRNPLFGPNGAAYVFGPQKGADTEQVALLDGGLRHLGDVLSNHFGIKYANTPGAGAAGGLGAGCMAFLDADLMSGSEAILELCGFEKQRAGADLIITGEGKLDEQSFSGKVLSGILRAAGGVPVFSICGSCECDESLLREHGVSVFKTCEGASVEDSMADPLRYIKLAARRAMRKACEELGDG